MPKKNDFMQDLLKDPKASALSKSAETIRKGTHAAKAGGSGRLYVPEKKTCCSTYLTDAELQAVKEDARRAGYHSLAQYIHDRLVRKEN
jgi:hypothetical protein